MLEVWKDVIGYEGRYMISNCGNVKSLARRRRKNNLILSSSENSSGYLYVCLYSGGKGSARTIHQMIAESFLNHTPDGHRLVVDHINNIRTDNALKNLQIITERENQTKDKADGTSKYTGVCWHKAAGKWVSTISVLGFPRHLGLFTSESEAGEAYQKALRELSEDEL